MATYEIGGNSFTDCLVPVAFSGRYFIVESGPDGPMVSVIVDAAGQPEPEIVRNEPKVNSRSNVTKGAGILTVTSKEGRFLYKVRPGAESSLVFGTLHAGEVEVRIRDREIRVGTIIFSDNAIIGHQVGILLGEDGAVSVGAPLPPGVAAWFRRKFVGSSIRLVDLVTAEASTIRRTTFEDCTILGPAVIVQVGAMTIDSCGWDGDEAGLFWETRSRDRVAGAVGIEDCAFIRCRFRNVGIGGPAEYLAQAKRGFGTAPAR